MSRAVSQTTEYSLPLDEVVALVMTAAGDVRVPVECWAIAAALETVRRRAVPQTAVGRALANAPRVTDLSGARYEGISAAVRALAKSHRLLPEGRAWHAGYRLHASWRQRCEQRLVALDMRDRRAIQRGAQRLVACLTSWSKNALA